MSLWSQNPNFNQEQNFFVIGQFVNIWFNERKFSISLQNIKKKKCLADQIQKKMGRFVNGHMKPDLYN